MPKNINPIKILGLWAIIVIVVDIVEIPFLYHHTVGGEQRPLTFFMRSMDVAIWGIFFLSITTAIPLIWKMNTTWYLNLIFFVASGAYLVGDVVKGLKNEYSYVERTEMINGSEIKTKKEYYSLGNKTLRSVSYWKNGKKDSIWTIFAEDGRVINLKRYKDGTLLQLTR
jgi:hypothetical protein